MEYKTLTFKATEVKTDNVNGVPVGVIEGYASTWDLDRGNDIIMQGAFTNTLAELAANGRTIRMLAGHSYGELIGGFPVMSCKQDDKGLWVRGEINLDVQKGAECYALAKQGVMCDMSIGFSIPSADAYEFKDIGGEVVRCIKDLQLWEISLVPEPMNPHAQITSVKDVKDLHTLKDVEALLKSLGCSKDAAKVIISTVKTSLRREASNIVADDEVSVNVDLAAQRLRLKLNTF